MKKSSLERTFDTALNRFGKDLKIGMLEEHRFHEKRRWRFDYCWPEKMIAVEIDGGQWVTGGGRHNTDKDREKINTAAIMGWRVLRFSGSQLTKDPIGCIDMIRYAINI